MNSSACYNLRCWRGEACTSSTACINHWGVLNTAGCMDLTSSRITCATGCVNATEQNPGPRIRSTVLETCGIMISETWTCDFKSYADCIDPAMLFHWAPDNVATRYETAENTVSDSPSTISLTFNDNTVTNPSTTSRKTVSFQPSPAAVAPTTSSPLLTPATTLQVASATAFRASERSRARSRQSELAIHVAFGACGTLLVLVLICVVWWIIRQKRRKRKAREGERKKLECKGIPKLNGREDPIIEQPTPIELPNECVKHLELSNHQVPGELA